MTAEQIEQMRADMKVGTPGPWELDGIAIAHPSEPYRYPIDVCLMGEPARDIPVMMQRWEINARRIARVPDMEAHILALTAERDKLKAEHDRWVERAYEAAQDRDTFEKQLTAALARAERAEAERDKLKSSAQHLVPAVLEFVDAAQKYGVFDNLLPELFPNSDIRGLRRGDGFAAVMSAQANVKSWVDAMRAALRELEGEV